MQTLEFPLSWLAVSLRLGRGSCPAGGGDRLHPRVRPRTRGVAREGGGISPLPDHEGEPDLKPDTEPDGCPEGGRRFAPSYLYFPQRLIEGSCFRVNRELFAADSVVVAIKSGWIVSPNMNRSLPWCTIVRAVVSRHGESG
jgi:hypothetical protein